MAQQKDISFYRGEDVTITDTITLPSGTTTIAGWSLQFTVRTAYGASSTVFTKTNGSGITITDAVNGIVTITIASADTSGLTPQNYVYDVSRVDGGNRAVLTVGILELLAEVSL